jgi:hypothetical protein
MSISSPRPPGSPADDCDACEQQGYHRLTLEWLGLAGPLGGGLSQACRAQRACLQAKLQGGSR